MPMLRPMKFENTTVNIQQARKKTKSHASCRASLLAPTKIMNFFISLDFTKALRRQEKSNTRVKRQPSFMKLGNYTMLEAIISSNLLMMFYLQ